MNVVRELAAGMKFLLAGRGDVALPWFDCSVRLHEVRRNPRVGGDPTLRRRVTCPAIATPDGDRPGRSETHRSYRTSSLS